jgi:hypothetical protein
MNYFAVKNLNVRVLGLSFVVLGAQEALAQHGSKTNRGGEGIALPRSAASKPACKDETDCATEVKLRDGTVVGSVVSRTVSDSGIVE